jgi:hypothetical protein
MVDITIVDKLKAFDRPSLRHGHAPAGRQQFSTDSAREGPDPGKDGGAVGLQPAYISRLEQGRNPTVATLYTLTQALGVTPLDLLSDETDQGARSREEAGSRERTT